jgi:hypothetical protein
VDEGFIAMICCQVDIVPVFFLVRSNIFL